MAAHEALKSASTTRRLLRPVGRGLIIIGLVGTGIWAIKAFGASYSATLAEESVVSDVAYVIDWIPKPGIAEHSGDDSDYLVVAKYQDDNIIWEGPQDEWKPLLGEAESAYQNDLRATWLYPSVAIALIGLLIVGAGRRGGTTEDSRT